MDDATADHYTTLGLHRRCTADEIRTAYRALAKQHHPDLQPDSADATERAQAINAAHEVLSDPSQRRAYDRDLRAAEAAITSARVGRVERNISQDVHVRIDELLRGATMSIAVRDPAQLGRAETYQLIIPAETPPGARFRLPRTESSDGGFLQLRVRALPSARFKLRGSDLQCDLRINARRALAGGSEAVTGPNGNQLRVEIPAGVKRGEIVKIRGAGLPKARGGRADLLVRIKYQPEVRVTRGASRW